MDPSFVLLPVETLVVFVTVSNVRINLEFLLRYLCSPPDMNNTLSKLPMFDRELTAQELLEIYNAAWSHEHLRAYLRSMDLLGEAIFVQRAELLQTNRRNPRPALLNTSTPCQQACCYLILFTATAGIFATLYLL